MRNFFEALTVMKLEEEYPKLTKRYDYLRDREKAGQLSEEESQELNKLDWKLMGEYCRIKLHYQLNWPQMDRDMKSKLREEVKGWRKE